MGLTTVKIDLETRALLKQMAARDMISMIEELRRLIVAEWAQREMSRLKIREEAK
jgi:hypothetical protein